MATSTTPLAPAELSTLRALLEALTSEPPETGARCPRCGYPGRPGAVTAGAWTCAACGAVWRCRAPARPVVELDHVATALRTLLGAAADVPLESMPPAELAAVVSLRDRFRDALEAARATGRRG
ncbi:hypothetical protein WMF18_29560 [Sorangium sp. So ce315]|uniref:hypothetical protein n=1 Tax=Sorangium sp. So ce315 TaxID=3133299 RepID=UPI003F621E18